MLRRGVINGQSDAVGLYWFPLKEDMKLAELVLEAEGYDEKCDLSVVLEKQYALARSRNRSWKRVRSLAATLVLNKYPDAVHVFPLVDADDDTPFWWVIGVRTLRKTPKAWPSPCRTLSAFRNSSPFPMQMFS